MPITCVIVVTMGLMGGMVSVGVYMVRAVIGILREFEMPLLNIMMLRINGMNTGSRMTGGVGIAENLVGVDRRLFYGSPVADHEHSTDK